MNTKEKWIELNKFQQAIAWHEKNNIPISVFNGNIYLQFNDKHEFQLSKHDIEFRSKLYLQDLN